MLTTRVTAFLQQRLFTEGTDVQEGDLLYRLERPPFEVFVIDPLLPGREKESEKGTLMELVPSSSEVYSKIQIPLVKCGQAWAGIGDLYFKSSPTRRYEAKIEVASEDIFSNKTLRVRTICPDAAVKTKTADITSTWTRKE